MDIFSLINNYSAYIIIGLAALCLILLILYIVSICQFVSLKKRFTRFMRPNSEHHNIEELLNEYLDRVENIKKSHDRLVVDIADIYNKLRFCVQKVGVVRYNSFADVGGDLCFAIALLDENQNGVVLNSIYSREGCYIYGKPIEKGTSTYKLSGEEIEAIVKAIKKE